LWLVVVVVLVVDLVLAVAQGVFVLVRHYPLQQEQNIPLLLVLVGMLVRLPLEQQVLVVYFHLLLLMAVAMAVVPALLLVELVVQVEEQVYLALLVLATLLANLLRVVMAHLL
jgi:hypothetical protein